MPNKRLNSANQRRLALILHAVKVFANMGYEQARTRDLHTEGFSESLYFKLFITKRGILRAVYDYFWEGLLKHIPLEVKTNRDPVERIRIKLRALVEYAIQDEPLWKVISLTKYPEDEGSQESRSRADFRTRGVKTITVAKHRLRFSMPPVVVYQNLTGAVEQIISDYFFNSVEKENRSRKKKVLYTSIDALIHGFFLMPGEKHGKPFDDIDVEAIREEGRQEIIARIETSVAELKS